MSYRPYSIAFVLGLVALAIGACGDSGGSTFVSTDGGPDGSSSQTPTSGFLPSGDGQAPAGDDDDDSDGGCKNDICVITPTSVCGDGRIDGSETCDDANGKPGDGCSGTCTTEPGYVCPTPGKDCVYTIAQSCGDGKIQGNESCDDGNKNDADGCSKGCDVEPGYSCTTPGQLCTENPKPACGDGAVNFGEECDDKNTTAGDGCSTDCKLEVGYTCPQPGELCQVLEYCSDGRLQAAKGEECDDGNGTTGDGCSAFCKLEPGFACPAPGNACTKIWICGNGKVDPGEICDDSNTSGTDGCSADCTQVEAGYNCPATGGPCVKVPFICGDAILTGVEQCDDGNGADNDGCSKSCVVEAGYTCPDVGKLCTKIAFCGDGKVNLDLLEECDDGDTKPNDGCTPGCKLEPNYVCPEAGKPCVSTVVCGDSKVTGAETCDDGKTVSGDGCSSTCTVEPGWQCPSAGANCIAQQCGDGIKAGNEQCDDGFIVTPATNTPGCDANCKIDPKYACAEDVNKKTSCHLTTCGDHTAEGSEQCDDTLAGQTDFPFDGCYKCVKEPSCTNGVCVAKCGDGQRFAGEECDDGNTFSGDGCSSDCKVEVGFACTDVVGAPPATIDLPLLVRDFIGQGNQINGATPHVDFNQKGAFPVRGIVLPDLDANGRMVPNCPGNDCTQNVAYNKPNAGQTNFTTAANFAEWYTDNAKNVKSIYVLPLKQSGGAYVWDSQDSTQNPNATSNPTFFDPVGTGGQVAAGKERRSPGCSPLRNTSWTTETHFFFEYQGGEQFSFSGDDDTWVFINGHLALDLGGLHTPIGGTVTLDLANGHGAYTSSLGNGDVDLKMTKGGIYEVAMFQAERNECGSNFKITLRGFNKPKSTCQSTCGDGIIASDEVCDDGKNDGSYGGCMPGCKARGLFCGDKTTTTPPEQCDDAVNQTTYGGQSKVCGPGCKFAPYCGDGTVSNGESCDDGTVNNTGAYGKCSGTCTLGPRCGDNIKNGPEECDHGINNGASADSCKADCTLRCGDGVKQAGEECDDGAAANTGGYGKCNPNCTLGPRCGDGISNGTEQCDDGKNDGSYGTCKSDCSLAPYCGDAAVNGAEICDDGTAQNLATNYGAGKCSNRCLPAPKCGDKAVDGAFGEVCDDGKNDGTPGSCAADCKSFIPNITCGNNTVNPGEQCDHGANNGKLGDSCDAHCHNTCGNGVKDPTEDCDNGVNDGSYGGCTSNCKVAGYCGDGIKNGPEQCDNKESNQPVATAYGLGICTQACTFAPYCGDGRVQSSRGEQCDGSLSCDSACKLTGPK
ncbi:MAG: DUF4215 domain-containing protein [Labilithrix sp.]